MVLPSRCVSNAPQMNPTRKTFLLHTIRSTSAGLKAADVLQDPMSVLCIRQRTPGPLLRASRPFTAGEQPDSASSQCQTATQQAIPSDQPAANLYLSDEIDPMRLDGLRRNLFWIVKCVSFCLRPPPGSSRSPSRASVMAASRSGRTNGGARRDRTDDIVLAKHALSQLSYGPLLEKTTCAHSLPNPPPSGRPSKSLAYGGPGKT